LGILSDQNWKPPMFLRPRIYLKVDVSCKHILYDFLDKLETKNIHTINNNTLYLWCLRLPPEIQAYKILLCENVFNL
jgi:hypothetical protein